MELSFDLFNEKEELRVTQSQNALLFVKVEVSDLVKFVEGHSHKVMLEQDGESISDINIAHQHRDFGSADDFALLLLD